MTTKTTVIFSLILIAAALLAGAWLWDALPDQIASHWNVNDEVDGYMSKVWGVYLLPLVTLGMLALLIVLPAADPLRANLSHFQGEYNWFVLFMTAFMLYLHGLTLAWSLGLRFRMSAMMLPLMGALFIFIGFLLRKAKRNYFIGLRTPWTLSSDTVWDQTHRVGSVLFMASGAFAMLGGFFGGVTAFWLVFAPLLGSTLFLTIYSYVLYRKESQS